MRTGALWASCALLVLAAGGAGAQWRAEGPALGALRDLAVDPARPDTVYAATANGGVYRSDDFGRSWTLPGTDLVGWDVLWVEADPGAPGTVWAGIDNTGEPSLYRSRDRGASWELVAGEYRGELGNMHPTGVRIAFAPSRPAEIWVPSTNLHYRSTDGGKSFTDFRVEGQDAYALAVDPTNPQVVYAGGRGERWNLSRSDDGGRTWTPGGQGIDGSVEILLVDPREPSTLYATYGFNNLVKSTDRGATFAPLPSPAEGTQHFWRLVLDPTTPHVLWAATEAGLFVSRDGGGSWTRSEQGTGRYLVRSVAIDPRDSRRLLAASGGGGVYRSEDGGANWSESGAGLNAGWIRELWGAEADAPLFVETTVGLWRRDPDGTWQELADPFVDDTSEVDLDGIVYDRRAPKSVWAFDTGDAWRSSDGGRSWQVLEPKEPSMREMLRGNLESAQFRSMAVDPGDSKVVYAGAWSNDEPGYAVFKSTDGGRSWKPAGNGVPNEAVTRLTAAAPGVLFATVEGEGLFRTDDGGGAWHRVGAGLPEGELRELTVDPAAATRVFAAFEQGLFRSTDSGESFEAVGSALAGEDVEAVVAAPDGRLYAASFHGIFRSTDGGGTWAAVHEGLPTADVRALVVAGGRLWAGTAGASVWSAPLP